MRVIWEVVGDVELDHDFHDWKENCKRSDERKGGEGWNFSGVSGQ